MSRSLALILFLASLLLLCPNSAHAQTYVRHCSISATTAGSGNTETATCQTGNGANHEVSANDVIVAFTTADYGTCPTMTDGFGLTWNFIQSKNNGGNTFTSCSYYAKAGINAGIDAITATWAGFPLWRVLLVVSYSGLDAASPLDQFDQGSAGASTTYAAVGGPVSVTSPSVTTTSGHELMLMLGESFACERVICGASQCPPVVDTDSGTPMSSTSGWSQLLGGGRNQNTVKLFDNLDSGPIGAVSGTYIGTATSPSSSQCTDQAGMGHPDTRINSWVNLFATFTSGATPLPTGSFIRGVWFLDGSAGSTGGGGGGGTGGGGTEDLMAWVVMDARRTNHLTPGYSAHYLYGDTVATATAGTNFAWIKNSGGNPWDINHFDNRNLYWWITENGEQAPTNASAYKRFISPVPIAPRYFTPGSTVTITTDGANPIIRTTNCEADHQAAININHIKGVTTGPSSTAWGGDVGTANTLLIQYYWGGSGAVYDNLEEHYLVKHFGRVAFKAYTWNGSSYSLTSSTLHNTLAVGGSPDPNFTCGYTSDWWQLVNGTVGTNPNPLSITTTSPLPNASLNAPYSVALKAAGGVTPYSWAVSSGSTPTGLTLQTTGTLDGTPSVAGTSTFTAQVTDSVAATFSKAFSITVIDSTTHSVDLSWSGGTGATSFNVYRSTVNGTCSPSIGSGCSKIGTGITQHTWSDANVVSGQHYFYVVTGVNSAGESTPSNQVAVTIP